MESLIERFGIFQKQIYQNGDFSVSIFQDAETGENFKVTGQLLPTARRIKYHLIGTMQFYQKTGEQTLQVRDFEIAALDTEEAFAEYLAMPPIKLSKIQGKKIWRLYGEDSVSVLDHEPEQVYQAVFQNLRNGEKRYMDFICLWKEQRALLKVTTYLLRFGIRHKDIVKCNAAVPKKYSTLQEAIEKNPYFMMNIPGVSIDLGICDEMAKQMKLPLYSIERIKAGILYVLRQAMKQGHIFLYSHDKDGKNGLITTVAKLLSITEQSVIDVLNTRPNEFILEKEKRTSRYRIYLKEVHRWESSLAYILYRLISYPVKPIMKKEKYEECLKDYEKQQQIQLSKKQKEAVETVVQNQITVITGGAGTGKTTCLKAILSVLDMAKLTDIVLLASTGKAARRLGAVTKREATTIHNYIQCDDGESGQSLYANSIESDVLVVDEFSMTDCRVAYLLFAAIKKCRRIVIVGDVEQLPAVGAGNVLKDLIDSKMISTVTLDVTHRQVEGSSIITNANKILKKKTDFIFDNTFSLTEVSSGEEATSLLVKRYQELIQQEHGMDTVQILSPMKKRVCGTNALNQEIQNILLPTFRKERLRVGDKIINTKNNYERNLNNGDMGIIVGFSNQTYQIQFETGVFLELNQTEMDCIDLAYAITVHKSQGSEFSYVLMPILAEHEIMLYPNLLYTAVTRAKKRIELFGSRDMLNKAVTAVRSLHRHTTLANRLVYAKEIYRK